MLLARVPGPDLRFATRLLEQFGGANGELKAAMVLGDDMSQVSVLLDSLVAKGTLAQVCNLQSAVPIYGPTLQQ